MHQSPQRHDEHAGDEGARARHRLRSQAGGGSRGPRVRAECGARRLPDQLRRRRQAGEANDDGCAARLRAALPAGFRPRQQGFRRSRRPAFRHRHEPGRQGASLRRDVERLPGRQPARLPVPDPCHRCRQPRLHVGPVRRAGAAFAALGRAEPQGAQRPTARVHHRGLATARRVQEGAHGAGSYASHGANGGLHQHRASARTRSRDADRGARRAQRRRHHRRGAAGTRARRVSGARGALRVPVPGDPQGDEGTPRGDAPRSRTRPARGAAHGSLAAARRSDG